MVWRLAWSTADRQLGGPNLPLDHFGFYPIQGSMTRGPKAVFPDVLLIEKSRATCFGGRFPSRFIHQVIIIDELHKLYDCMFSP